MEKENKKRKPAYKRVLPVLLGIVLIGGLAFGVHEYIFYKDYATTDDAQIDANINPVVARVSGYVKQIRFNDNQWVDKGDTLVVLDDRDYKIKLEQALASLAASHQNVGVSKSTVAATRANIASAKAKVDAAKAKLWNITQQYNRYKNLYEQQAVTKSAFDDISTQKQAAESELKAAKSQYAVVSKQVGTSQQEVNAATAHISIQQANVNFARLQLSYTVITAPVSGVVSRRNIQIGQLVSAGQNMFAVVNDSSTYVTANFKETQLTKMKPGQPAEIDVDAYPHHKFEGVVNSFSGATGAKFSLLPPENATGNFVKVVQRVPVKITFKNLSKEWQRRLLPGLSVEAKVKIQ